MGFDEFDKVESPALEQLQSLGWLYVDGAKLSPEESDERESFKEVVLEKRLIASIKRINPWINEENIRKVVSELTKAQYPNLVEANQSIWNIINQCVSVMQDLGMGNKGQTVHIIDFKNPENNEFLCTNQFKVSGLNQNIIPDIILFVNGLPLVVIECKSPFVTNPMEGAIKQLLRYANRRDSSSNEGAEKLFYYNQMMISSCRDKTRLGTITSSMEHYLEWKDPYPLTVAQLGPETTSQEIMIAGLFTKTNFLDIIQNFIVFEPVDARVIKKIARYQQFRAVQKTIRRIKTNTSRKEKGGIIWHTQGSGKSLTMVFLTIKMRRDPELRDYKLVFLIDRTQLSTQLSRTFTNTQNETIRHADSIKALKDLLATDASDIVIAMVQKFRESTKDFKFPLLNKSEKIIVLADEAHRTQYGALGAGINTALPNAPKIAFTGTPLIKSQKTQHEFGSYIDTYTIEQAVEDGATVQILYEGREAELRVTGDSLDSLFDKYFSNKSDEEKAAIKRKFSTMQAILEAPQRIRRVCIDILEHYRGHIQPNGFKAMIVTSSRRAAIIYKEQLDKLEAPESTVIISGNHNDEKRFLQYTDRTKHQNQTNDFKKPLGTGKDKSNLSILIVTDMLLTGFDAPIAQVMYIDRKLTDHTLLQAIARVNRTNKNKFRGYIVDYYGLIDYLTEALNMFSTTDIAGALKDIKDEIPKLKNSHTRVIQHFNGLNLDDLDECIFLLKDDIKRQNFQKDFRTFAKQMDIILPDSAAAPFLQDLKHLGKISIGARNLYRDEQLNIVGVGEKVRELIEEHVRSIGINPKIPPIDLLAGNYKERLNEHKSPRAQASEIEHAIKDHIKKKLADDPEYYKKLSARLEDIIRTHEGKWKELIQLFLNFRENIEDDHKKNATDIGLSSTEFSFYNILIAEVKISKNEGNLDKETLEKIKEMTQSLVSILDKATKIVGFFNKRDEKRRVKIQIKRAVLEYLDESLIKPVTDRFMELARNKFNDN